MGEDGDQNDRLLVVEAADQNCIWLSIGVEIATDFLTSPSGMKDSSAEYFSGK